MVMYYAPHILQKKVSPVLVNDEFGRPVKVGMDEEWEFVAWCRCDMQNQTEVKSDNGEFFKPDFHIVCEGRGLVKAGDVVRVLFGRVVKCQGQARSVKETNYLNYTEVWV